MGYPGTLAELSRKTGSILRYIQWKCNPPLRDSDNGVAMAELVICLPVLFLVFLSITEFGELRIKQLLINTAAYEAAHASARGLDGKAAAESFLTQYKIKGAEITVSKHYSIVNYYESFIRFDLDSNRFLEQFITKPMTITKKARAYCEKHIVIEGDTAYKDGEIYKTKP